jgi:hypothetical protein
MMEFLYYYVLFSLTTAIYSWFAVFRPVKFKLLEQDVDHLYIKRPLISSLVFLAFTCILSPVFFIIVLSDNVKEAMIEGMYEGSL